MQWVPNDENKRRDEAFADFIGGVAYEEDRGWTKEVWDAAWSARRDEAIAEAEKQEPLVCGLTDDGRFTFSIGVQTFTLDYSPETDAEMEFMQRQLTHAFHAVKLEWVGLTGEDRQHFRGLGFVGVEQVEAKLREKNHG